MWEVILLLAGCGIVDCCMALVDTLSNLKYVCTGSTSDTVVQMFFVIDCIRVAKGALVAALAGWGHYNHKRRQETDSAGYLNAVGSILILCLFVFLWTVVQQTEACGNCVTDSSVSAGTIDEDVHRMLGNSLCRIHNPGEKFKIAQNYCREQLDLMCSPLDVDNNFGERCLVGACNGLVHGNRMRYLYSLTMQAAEVVVCLLLMVMSPEMINANKVPPRKRVMAKVVESSDQYLVKSNIPTKKKEAYLVMSRTQGMAQQTSALDDNLHLRQRTSRIANTLQF